MLYHMDQHENSDHASSFANIPPETQAETTHDNAERSKPSPRIFGERLRTSDDCGDNRGAVCLDGAEPFVKCCVTANGSACGCNRNVVVVAHVRFGSKKWTIGACFSSGRRRVTGEDVVAIFGRLVTGEASFVQRLVAWFAILEVGKCPATSRRVLL